jgi:hypothetical protein
LISLSIEDYWLATAGVGNLLQNGRLSRVGIANYQNPKAFFLRSLDTVFELAGSHERKRIDRGRTGLGQTDF